MLLYVEDILKGEYIDFCGLRVVALNTASALLELWPYYLRVVWCFNSYRCSSLRVVGRCCAMSRGRVKALILKPVILWIRFFYYLHSKRGLDRVRSGLRGSYIGLGSVSVE